MNSIPATLRRIDQIEGPPGLPLLGNALQIDPPRMHLQMERWAQRYGRFFSLRIGGQRLLAINDTALSQQILRDRPDRFRRLRTLEPIARELGMDGLFSAEGERWKAQRRLWLATLNAHQIRAFHDQLMLTTRRLRQRWQRAADSGEAVDIAADLMRYTVDVTIHFALGHEANTLERDDDIIQRHLDRIFPALNRRLFGVVPYWRWFKLPQDRALERSLDALRSEVGQLIDGARQRLREQPALREAPTCFLEAFLAANERDGAVISDEDVFANAITVLLGGEDTTANTMAWLIHACCDRPDVYAALRAEADALLDDPASPDAEIPRADRFPHWLRATDAAINETLRLYPVAPAIYLETIADTVIEDIELPAHTPVTLLLRAAAGSSPHSAPPPRFDPVADAARSDAGPGRAATMPFGYGPRMCPGRNLALAELRSATLMLARNFEIEAVPQAQPVVEKLSFTLVPENLRVRFKRRVR